MSDESNSDAEKRDAPDGENQPGAAPVIPARRTPRWRFVLLAIFSVGVTAAIVAGAGAGKIADVFSDIGWLGVLHILSLYTVGQLLRAARFTACLAPPRPAIPRMFAVVCMHQFLNHVLPARLGELSFPLLASRYANIKAATATRLLIVIRIYELVVLGIFFLVAACTLLFRAEHTGLSTAIIWAAALLVLLALLLPLAMPRIVDAVRRVLESLPVSAWQKSRLRIRMLAYLETLHAEFRRPRSLRETVSVLLFSFLIWSVLFWINYQVLHYAGIDVTFLDAIVGSTFANVSQVLPLNTFGSIGSLEAGWTFGFVLLGVPAKAALASGFALHAIGIAFLSVTATTAWLFFQRDPQPGRQS